jgi:hypothetical protein
MRKACALYRLMMMMMMVMMITMMMMMMMITMMMMIGTDSEKRLFPYMLKSLKLLNGFRCSNILNS